MEGIEFCSEVQGASALVDWFGFWPSFHDAEVVSMELHRTGTSCIKVHTFATTESVDARGYYATTKHVIVSFLLEDISFLQLEGFNHQNVIFGLNLQKTDSGYELTLSACYGVAGRIVASGVRLAIEPGVPQSSMYRNTEKQG